MHISVFLVVKIGVNRSAERSRNGENHREVANNFAMGGFS